MNIKAWLAFLLAVMVPAGGGKGRQTENRKLGETVQRAMDGSLKDSGAVGVSAAIIFPDGETWRGASGMSHEGVPLTPNMLFDIASIQKNFQAALALKLVEKGLLGLDDPLDKWLPPYPNINGKTTIRQVMSLTSGIDNIVSDPKSPWRVGYHNIDFEKIWTFEEILREFVGEPNSQPGERCAYSSTNYIILRQIIEKASRSKQSTFFENTLLKPHHLDHTLAEFFKPIPKSMPFAHAWLDARGDGNLEDISGHSLNWVASIAPMFVFSTPGDMAKWMRALYHEKTVLSQETLKAMLSFRGPVEGEPLMKGYGLGVVDINIGLLLPKWDAIRCYGHLGSQFGYTTFAGYFPDYGLSMAIMFNRGCDEGTDKAVSMVSGAIFDALFGELGVRTSKPRDTVSE